ncbi:hypothetical protein O181_077976 [Austropuccinia psidii MF-1]|uniref:Integrase catalytic domain-containing protein n=1 Tax=Austropuccinia psidii MF-1 TaxID=1389203 RepID=A0A9Q3FDD8_9BASI|nr:hypothetical protein [Austropuccinia psidii MF-1]
MPRKEAADDHDVGTKGSPSDLLRVLDAVDALTSKVQSLQLELDFHKQVRQSPRNDINPTLCWFFKDPLSLHFSVNPRKPILTFDGRNFLAWQEALSTTISFVYKLKDQPILVFLKNTDPDSEASFFLVICQTVEDSSHAPQHWQCLMNSSDAVISLHILTNWSHKTQDTVNKSTFDVVLHNHLGRLNLPATFKSVSKAIQAAETAAAIPAKMTNHFYQETVGPPNQTPPQHLPPNMLEKVTAFKGRGQTKSLIEQFGNLCRQSSGSGWNEASSKGKAPQVYTVEADAMDDQCLVDLAADIHMSGDNPDFMICHQLTWPILLHLASSGHTSHLTAIGSLRIPTPSGMLIVKDVYYCRAIRSTILSLGQLIEEGFAPLFTAQAWHERLGHESAKVVRDFLTWFVPGASRVEWMNFFCKQCAHSKSTKEKKTPMTRIPLGKPLDLLVSDVAGPFPADPAGNRFLLALRDHASTFILTAALKYRKDVPSRIVEWVKFLYGRTGRFPAQLRTDNAGKYSAALEAELRSMGTEWVPVEPY